MRWIREYIPRLLRNVGRSPFLVICGGLFSLLVSLAGVLWGYNPDAWPHFTFWSIGGLILLILGIQIPITIVKRKAFVTLALLTVFFVMMWLLQPILGWHIAHAEDQWYYIFAYTLFTVGFLALNVIVLGTVRTINIESVLSIDPDEEPKVVEPVVEELKDLSS